MESAYFYNTFFSVAPAPAPAPAPMEVKPLLEAIKQLPDELGEYISKFVWNLKEAFAQVRLERLQDTKEILTQFRKDDTFWWLKKWEKNNNHWFFKGLKLIKVCKKTVKVEIANRMIKLYTFEQINHLIGKTLKDIDRVIANCAYWARPKPQFFGQEHIDILGDRCSASWCFSRDNAYHQGDGIVIDGQWHPRQGCVRKELRWIKY